MSTICFGSKRRLLRIIVLQLAIMAVAACSSPTGMPQADNNSVGRIALSVGSSSMGAQTVFPKVEQELIKSYHILLEGGSVGTTERTVLPNGDGSFPGNIVIEDVVPGTWKVTITAYNGEDPEADESLAILRGSADGVVVTAGGLTEVPHILLEFIDDGGSGTIEFKISWPADSGVYNLAYSIVPFEGGSPAAQWTNVNDGQFSVPDEDDDDRVSYTIVKEEIEVGVYLSTVRIDIAGDAENEDSRNSSVWVMDEIVYVRENVTTFTEIAVDEKSLTEVFVDSFSKAIVNEGDWEESGDEADGDFLYTGTGGTTITFDAFDRDVTLYFRVRNENNARGGGPFDDNQVTVVDADSGDSLAVEDVPYPYGDSTRDEDADFLGKPFLGERNGDETADKGAAYDGLGLDELGFLHFAVDIDAGTAFEIVFAGGVFREYSIGFFEVVEREE